MPEPTPRDRLTDLILDTREQGMSANEAADHLLGAGVRLPARVIETVEELDALQPAQALIDSGRSGQTCHAAVVRDRIGRVFERDMDNLQDEVYQHRHAGWWTPGHNRDDIDSSTLAYPVTVLDDPEDARR